VLLQVWCSMQQDGNVALNTLLFLLSIFTLQVLHFTLLYFNQHSQKVMKWLVGVMNVTIKKTHLDW
jgi:hypothetical protein